MYHWVYPTVASYTRDSSIAADRGEGMGGGGQQGQFAPGSQCKRAPKQCSTHSNTHPSLASLRVSFHCIGDFKSACFLFRVYAARTQISMHTS